MTTYGEKEKAQIAGWMLIMVGGFMICTIILSPFGAVILTLGIKRLKESKNMRSCYSRVIASG